MIYMDSHRRELDAAEKKYRSAYNRYFNMSERGDYEKAQAGLDRINQELADARERFAEARNSHPAPKGMR